jgi:Fe-S-cluster containining protein
MTVLGLIEEKRQVEPVIACFRCGICCTEYQAIISVEEKQRIADKLEITPEDFQSRYTDKRWPGAESFLLRKLNGSCIFFERIEGSKATRCRIHAFRPSSCVDWVPSLYRRECRRGLAKYWGLVVDSSGHLEGPAIKIREFRDLVESLVICDFQDINYFPPNEMIGCKPEKAG